MAAGSSLQLSLPAARALHLAAQGVLNAPKKRATKADVLAAIRRMGVLQIDTIHVVARSPYLVLYSRLGAYDQDWLGDLLAERQLFEYWAHEACFVPIEDYRLYRHRMLDPASMGWQKSLLWTDGNRREVDAIVEHIRANGQVRSADFKRTDGKKGGWWEWKPEKRALEALFTTGRVMIAARQNFHRIYDLAERILPDWRDENMPSMEETQRTLMLKAVHALGFAKASWIADYFRTARIRPRPDPEELAAEGLLLKAEVEGWNEPVYIHPEQRALAESAAAGRLKPTLTTLLSPFDPVVWDRKRALELFNFDYRLECYTPEPKRVYGYFTLPILHRGKLVGRLDAKAHRGDGIFQVKVLYLEPGIHVTQRLVADVAAALVRCAAWHGCERVAVDRSDPRGMKAALKTALAG